MSALSMNESELVGVKPSFFIYGAYFQSETPISSWIPEMLRIRGNADSIGRLNECALLSATEISGAGQGSSPYSPR